MPDQKSTRRDWSVHEINEIIKDYMDMLRKEAQGIPYSKTKHREALADRLDHRSYPSIEYKHRNISSVLEQLGRPYIRGYKPLPHIQQALADKVYAFLARGETK